MSRIVLDPLSEEMLSPIKVPHGPKSSSSLIDTKGTDKSVPKPANLNTTDEIRARFEGEALEKVKCQLSNAIEEASEKSAQTRFNGFQKIVDILIHHYIPEIVDDRKLTITELVEKSLRRVNGIDLAVAAKTGTLLVIQLGNQYDDVQLISQYILKAVLDTSNEIRARAECCGCLAVIYFLRDLENIEEVMNAFENIFNKVAVSEDDAHLHSAALFSWGLLFTRVSSTYSDSGRLLELTNHLIQLLESPYLNIRVQAGEILCLILEYSRATKNVNLIATIEETVDTAKFLSHDTQKFRHKHDLKIQRATFRDISRYFEENVPPCIKVVFGAESMEIKTWALHQQYVGLCSIIGPAMVTHLIYNEFIRNALNVDEISMPLHEKSYKQELYNEKERVRTLERRDDRKYKFEELTKIE